MGRRYSVCGCVILSCLLTCGVSVFVVDTGARLIICVAGSNRTQNEGGRGFGTAVVETVVNFFGMQIHDASVSLEVEFRSAPQALQSAELQEGPMARERYLTRVGISTLLRDDVTRVQCAMRVQCASASSPEARRLCGTPGCSLLDRHAGLCEPLRNLDGPRARQAKRPFDGWPIPKRLVGESTPVRSKAQKSSQMQHEKPRRSHPTTSHEVSRGVSDSGVSNPIAPIGDWASSSPNPKALRTSMPSATHSEPIWVQCDRCSKWRFLVDGSSINMQSDWFCEMSPDPSANRCDDDLYN